MSIPGEVDRGMHTDFHVIQTAGLRTAEVPSHAMQTYTGVATPLCIALPIQAARGCTDISPIPEQGGEDLELPQSPHFRMDMLDCTCFEKPTPLKVLHAGSLRADLHLVCDDLQQPN